MPMDEEARQVWENYFGDAQYGYDCCGARIFKGAHGKRGKYSWQKDHIKPGSKGGKNALKNLRPLHWKNNVERRNRPDGRWTCAAGRVGSRCAPGSERPE